MDLLLVAAGAMGLLALIGFFFLGTVLLVPTVLSLWVERKGDGLLCWVRIGLIGGLLGIGACLDIDGRRIGVFAFTRRLMTFRIRKSRAQDKQDAREERAPKPTEKDQHGHAWLSRLPGLKRPAIALLRSMPAAVALRRVTVRGRFGSGDPATTGMLFGWLQSLRSCLDARKVQIAVSPDFAQRRLEGAISLVLTVHLLRIGVSFTRFAYNVYRIASRR